MVAANVPNTVRGELFHVKHPPRRIGGDAVQLIFRHAEGCIARFLGIPWISRKQWESTTKIKDSAENSRIRGSSDREGNRRAGYCGVNRLPTRSTFWPGSAGTTRAREGVHRIHAAKFQIPSAMEPPRCAVGDHRPGPIPT